MLEVVLDEGLFELLLSSTKDPAGPETFFDRRGGSEARGAVAECDSVEVEHEHLEGLLREDVQPIVSDLEASDLIPWQRHRTEPRQ